MKIAFDLRRVGNPGVGRYMKCLVEAILQLETDSEYLLLLPPNADDAIGSNSKQVTQLFPRARYYSIREQIELPRILRRQNVALLHSPHFLLPLSCPCPAVATIHDVIYLACPQDLPSRIGRSYYRAMIHASARRANRIITVSEFSKGEIVRYLQIDPQKITVVHSGIDPTFVPEDDRQNIESVLSKYAIDTDYIFYAGIYKPRKNHCGLLKAFRHFLGRAGKAQLVISGAIGDGQDQLRRLAEQLGIAERLVFTGGVSDLDLRVLYSAARVYACPSLYEGFGFTVLEAMACGTPVVCSRVTSLPEIAGNAALYADAQSAGEFGEALHQAFTKQELRSILRQRGFDNVRRFRWETVAKACLGIYGQIIETACASTAA